MATLIDKYFSGIDFDAIEAATSRAEQSTSGEIAVEITARSKRWLTESLVHAFVVAVICGFVALYLTRENNWGVYYNFTQAVLWTLFGFAAGYFGWGRFLKRNSRQEKVVWFRSLERFGMLTPVRNKAGALIFVSLEENQAAIVVEKGIGSKVEPRFWREVRDTLTDTIEQGKHAEGIIAALETIGAKMAEHFPREDDDFNELPDKPTIVK
jgi:putative membrane protein